MSLGTYPEVTLREARSLRDEGRALLAKGVNPRVHRKQKRTAVRFADQNTFEAVYRKWLKHRGLSLNEGRQTTLSILPRIFDKDVLPALGKRSIYEIKHPDLLEVIARIEKRRALSVAGKVRTWFNQLFRYALVIVPGLEQNPASDGRIAPTATVRPNWPQVARPVWISEQRDQQHDVVAVVLQGLQDAAALAARGVFHGRQALRERGWRQPQERQRQQRYSDAGRNAMGCR